MRLNLLIIIFELYIVSSSPQKSCGLRSDIGESNCDEYSMKYFFHAEFGECSRFWYGGCGGNENRFDTIEECISTCVSPSGKLACKLPHVRGPCTQNNTMWYYDDDNGACSQFNYSGCLGNANRFESYEECHNLCGDSDDENEIVSSNFAELSTTTTMKAIARSQCTDNGNFANCEQVVSTNLCHHVYYKRFCCHSCSMAGNI